MATQPEIAKLLDRAHLEPLRAKLADGIPPIVRDPSVSDQKKQAIAAARTAVLWLLFGGVLISVFFSHSVHLLDATTESPVQLSLDFCGAGAPKLSSTGTDREGFLKLLASGSRKLLLFAPVGAAASELGLPELHYYESEEYLAAGPEHTIGCGASLFKVNGLRLPVRLNRTGAHACLAALAEEHGIKENVLANFYGKAVVAALAEAGRRIPQARVTGAPIVLHGSLLLWKGHNDSMWSLSQGIFDEPYSESDGWHVYWWVTHALRSLCVLLLLMAYTRYFCNEWVKAVEVWTVQYDYLWEKQQDCVLVNRTQSCSTFFVLDNVLGNAQKNMEVWSLGMLSSAVQALLLIAFVPLPLLHGYYFSAWKEVSVAVVGWHCLFSMAFGTTYYWSVSYAKRWVLLWLHFGACAACVVYSVAYLVCICLFMVTRLVANPAESAAYAIPIGTAVVYAIVMGNRLVQMRDHYIAAWAGKKPKGLLLGFLYRLNLSVGGIIFTIISGVLFILLFTMMLLLVSALYVTTDGLGDFVSAFITPIITFVGCILQLTRKRDALNKAVGDNIDDIFFDIF